MLVRPDPSLWTLITAPMVWAGHFLACYLVAAVFCAKATTGVADLTTVRLGIGAATLVALLLISALRPPSLSSLGSLGIRHQRSAA